MLIIVRPIRGYAKLIANMLTHVVRVEAFNSVENVRDLNVWFYIFRFSKRHHVVT